MSSAIYKILLCFLLLSSVKGFSQDLIITVDNDSIKAYIKKADDAFLYYEFKKSGLSRSAQIPIDLVKDQQKDYYTIEKEKLRKSGNKEFSGFSIQAYGGWSHFTKYIPNYTAFSSDSYKELKNGYHLGVDFHYFINNNFGLGMRYSSIHFRNEFAPFQYDIQMQFIGPKIMARLIAPSKLVHFTTEVSPGKLFYTGEKTNNNTFTGETFGFYIGQTVEFILNKNLLFYVSPSFTLSRFKEYERDNGGVIKPMNIEKVNILSTALGFRLFF